MTSKIKVDTIEEKTSSNGVSIDSVTLKDGGVNTTANVGIGTSSPVSDARLTVSSPDTESAIFLERSNSGKFDAAIHNTGGSLIFKGGSNQTTVASLTEFMRISAAGEITKPLQPAFLGSVTSTQSNLASGDHILFPEIRSIDRNGDYASSIFTAPVDGLYQFNIHVSVTQLDRTATFNRIQLQTTNQTYSFDIRPAQLYDSDPSYHAFDGSILADLDTGDTAFVRWSQSGGSSQADVFDSSFFSGFLVC